jgi:hypothetical protein
MTASFKSSEAFEAVDQLQASVVTLIQLSFILLLACPQ